MHQKINREPRQQDTNKITDTPNPEKQVNSNRNEPQSNNKRNITHTNHTEQTLTQEEMNLENLERIFFKTLDYHC